MNFSLVMTSREYARNSVKIEITNESNVKNVLLSAKLHVATFLFDACFEYVCKRCFDINGKDPMFAWDVAKVDGQL
jgi:hypothetical protein